jgi:hypothetical protein
LATDSYTVEQMLLALNSAIVAQGANANGITTSMGFTDGLFVINCATDYPAFGIEIYGGSALANNNMANSLGFDEDQAALGFGGSLSLVAVNTYSHNRSDVSIEV